MEDQENEPPASRVRLDVPQIQDTDAARRRERERQAALRQAETELSGVVDKPKPDPKLEIQKMALTVSFSLSLQPSSPCVKQRGGGTYIPPHRLKAMMADQQAQDAASVEFQRMTWEALRKSINGLINKVTSRLFWEGVLS